MKTNDTLKLNQAPAWLNSLFYSALHTLFRSVFGPTDRNSLLHPEYRYLNRYAYAGMKG